MSPRWLLLAFANVCVKAAAYEVANNVQVDEVGLSQPRLEEKLRQRRPVAAQSMVAVLLSISAALLVTFLMLQCFKFLQRSEKNGFLARRLALGGEDPCKGDEDNKDEEGEKEEEMFGPFRGSQLIRPEVEFVQITLDELRKQPIYAVGVDGPVQDQLTDDELIRFWAPVKVIRAKTLGPFKIKDIYATIAPDLDRAKISEIRKLPVHVKKVDGPVQDQFTDEELKTIWGLDEVIPEEEETMLDEYKLSELSSPDKAPEADKVKISELRKLKILANGKEVQDDLNDQEIIMFWNPKDIIPEDDDDSSSDDDDDDE